MTTQKQLMELAQKHTDHVGVRALLPSIHQANGEALQYLTMLNSSSETLQKGVSREDGYAVMRDNSALMMHAFKASSALDRVAAYYVDLAVVLELIGEKVEY